MPRPLEPEREAEFRAWWHDPAVTVAEMGRRLGRRSGCAHKMGVCRWGPRPLPPSVGRPLAEEDLARAREIVAAGGTVAEAARQLGRQRAHLGTALKRPTRRTDRRDRALRMLRAGDSTVAVARAVGASPELVCWWRDEAGLESGAARKRRLLAAHMRRDHGRRRAVREVGEMVAALDAGWPLCSRGERRALEALEVGPATVAELSVRMGITYRSVTLNRTLVRCLGHGWVTRARCDRWSYRWRLSEAVTDRRREIARAGKDRERP